MLEETHYYPFGLTMAGISHKALNNAPGNKIRFNGYEQQNAEFSDGSGLEWYDYKNRFYDNQIGRFFVQDRLADQFVYYSPYQFAGNQVPNAIDLDGLEELRVNPLEAGSQYSSNNPAVSTGVGRSMEQKKIIYSSTTSEKIRKTSSSVGRVGGIVFTSESGQGGAKKASKPDGQMENIDGLIAAFGAAAQAAPLKLSEVSAQKVVELGADAVELVKSDIANEEKDGKKISDNISSSTKPSKGSEDNGIKINTVFYSTFLKYNRLKTSDSTAEISFEPATDTLKPGKRW